MKRTPEKKIAFCSVLAETCNVGRACKTIDISRTTAYEWRKEDEEFAEAWDRAIEIGVTALEDEARRRAFEGVDKPLSHQGQLTPMYEPVLDDYDIPVLDDDGMPRMRPVFDEDGKQRYVTIKEYSDTLAIFLLKAHAPEKYRERTETKLTMDESIAEQLRKARERTGQQD